MQASALDGLKLQLRENGRKEVDHVTLISAAASLKQTPMGSNPKFAMTPAHELGFKGSLLAPFFTRFAVVKGSVIESGCFDCKKLARYHFWLSAEEVQLAPDHPLSDWMDQLKDFTGTHSLAPAALVPQPLYGGGILQAVSYCLVGVEMYWHAFATALLEEFTGPRQQLYTSLVTRDGELDNLLDRMSLETDSSLPGTEIPFHPLLLQAVSNILGRVIILFDPWTDGKSANSDAALFIPWILSEDIYAELSEQRMPPLCICWEGKDKQRFAPLIPVKLQQPTFVPDQIVPPPHRWRKPGAHISWKEVKEDLLPLDKNGRCTTTSTTTKTLSRPSLLNLIQVMGSKFQQSTGISLQVISDIRGMLFSLGVGIVPHVELVCDAAEALEENRVFYNGISCQLTPRKGLYTRTDLVQGGVLYEAALRERESLAGAHNHGSRENVVGRRANGIELRGVDVPHSMPPGKLRVHVSILRTTEAAPDCVYLTVRNTGPNGEGPRTARLSKNIPEVNEETAIGIEVPLAEEGTHSILLSIVPASRPSDGAPEEVAVLDAGDYRIQVGSNQQEQRSNLGTDGAAIDYTKALTVKEEPGVSFTFGETGLMPADSIKCRCSEDQDRMRAIDSTGTPAYADGDCTLNPSAPGSCCDRKHWWGGKEYDNYPLEFNLSLVCPTSYHESGQTIVHVVWHDGESDSLLNSNVYDVGAKIIQEFW